MFKKFAYSLVALSLLATGALAQSSSTHTSIANDNRNNDTYTYTIAPGTTNPNITQVKNKAGAVLNQVSNPTTGNQYRVDITSNPDGSHSVSIEFGDDQPLREEMTVTTERDGGSTPDIEDEDWENKTLDEGGPQPV